MIRSSFIFLEKIGKRKEKNIWKQGVKDWNKFLSTKKIAGISGKKKYYYDRKIREAQQALLEDNSSYFTDKMPNMEKWRLYSRFKEECGYLDLEIDSRGRITMLGISDYYNTSTFMRGFNLEKTLVEKELQKYKLLVTFNGSSFDLPKLKKQLGCRIGIPHIDLKHLCINLGLKGGLKEVEKALNLNRPTHLYGNPVELWKAFHASGDKEYLDLLVEYNREDCENLKFISMKVCTSLQKSLFSH